MMQSVPVKDYSKSYNHKKNVKENSVGKIKCGTSERNLIIKKFLYDEFYPYFNKDEAWKILCFTKPELHGNPEKIDDLLSQNNVLNLSLNNTTLTRPCFVNLLNYLCDKKIILKEFVDENKLPNEFNYKLANETVTIQLNHPEYNCILYVTLKERNEIKNRKVNGKVEQFHYYWIECEYLKELPEQIYCQYMVRMPNTEIFNNYMNMKLNKEYTRLKNENMNPKGFKVFESDSNFIKYLKNEVNSLNLDKINQLRINYKTGWIGYQRGVVISEWRFDLWSENDRENEEKLRKMIVSLKHEF